MGCLLVKRIPPPLAPAGSLLESDLLNNPSPKLDMEEPDCWELVRSMGLNLFCFFENFKRGKGAFREQIKNRVKMDRKIVKSISIFSVVS